DGCNTAFEVMKEFVPQKYFLRRAGGEPFGSFAQVQALLRRAFPAIQFGWTLSGPERIQKICESLKRPPSPEERQRLEHLPSLLEGVAEGEGYRVTFHLGHQEPVACLSMTLLGSSPELERGRAALEAEAGLGFQVSESC